MEWWFNNITSPEVWKRASGVGFLLLNHPLDCPICDQAGECHLQDLGYENGKLHARGTNLKEENLKNRYGDHIKLHMTRCILYRCKVADQLTDHRLQGVMNRGDVSRSVHTFRMRS